MDQITITCPDDWHLHVRDEELLQYTVHHSARYFARAIIMPNLKVPVVTTSAALAYRKRIVASIPNDKTFLPLMTLYLTAQLTPQEIANAVNTGLIYAVKLYPSGVTTNSAAGIANLESVYPALEALQKLELPLLIHAETPTPDIDIFDREKIFLDRELTHIVQHFPDLRIVIEHITTKDAVQYINAANSNIAATITAHHLLYNRNALLTGCLKPHLYCLPILKREEHRQALIAAATGGSPRFFLGTDSAPHVITNKENACGCAGSFTAHAAIELYAEIFENVGALSKLEAFAAFHGADFYRLPRNTSKIQITKKPWLVPKSYNFGNQQVVPIRANELVNWQVTA